MFRKLEMETEDGLNPAPKVFASEAPRRTANGFGSTGWLGEDDLMLDSDDESGSNSSGGSNGEGFDPVEVFDIIRDINDPEHPLTLEQLKVLTLDNIDVDDASSRITIHYTPTIPHCSMATMIGLCLRAKIERSLPPRFKVDIRITPGSHSTEAAINKQLNDKERIAAALENVSVLTVVNRCLARSVINQQQQ